MISIFSCGFKGWLGSFWLGVSWGCCHTVIGAGVIWKLPWAYVWWSVVVWLGAQLMILAGTPTHGLPVWHGLLHSLAARFQKQMSQENQAEVPFLLYSLRSLIVSLPPFLLVMAITKGLSRFKGKGHSPTTWWEEYHHHPVRRTPVIRFGGHFCKI